MIWSPRNVTILGLMAMLFVFASACAPAQRYVTHTYWESPTNVYIAFAEKDPAAMYAKVQQCTINPDNSVVCVEQENLNAVLNP